MIKLPVTNFHHPELLSAGSHQQQVPNTQYPIPNTQYPIPNTQYYFKRAFKLCFIIFINISFFANGQQQLKYWVLPPHYVGFTPNSINLISPPVNIPLKSFNGLYAQNGAINFLISDDYITDIANGWGQPLSVVPGCTQSNSITEAYENITEIPIIPVPGSTNKYYIIKPYSYYEYDECNALLTCHDIIDYYGQEPEPDNTNTQAYSTNKRNNFAVTPEFTDGGIPKRLLFVYHAYDPSSVNFNDDWNQIMVFEINNGGIVKKYWRDLTNISPHPLLGADDLKTEMECVYLGNGRYRIATCLYGNFNNNWPFVDSRYMLYYEDFQYLNGNVTSTWNSQVLDLPESDFIQLSPVRSIISGLEFSPDGNIIYFTIKKPYDLIPSQNHIYYYNISTNTFSPLAGTTGVIPNESDFRFSFIEAGYEPDNISNPSNQKIYFNAGNRLAYLSDPNTPDIANFHDNAVQLAPPSSNLLSKRCFWHQLE